MTTASDARLPLQLAIAFVSARSIAVRPPHSGSDSSVLEQRPSSRSPIFCHLTSIGTIAGLTAGGLLLLANGALRLRGWARLRGREMEGLAAQMALPPGSTTPPESQADSRE